MTNTTEHIRPDGSVFYKRRHQKADGRHLFLYGEHPPQGEARAESLQGAGPGAELRWHPLLQEWSIYAAHRQNRTFMPSAADDPLAPTIESGALTEIEFADFEVAVFQNRFASLHPQAEHATVLPGEITVKPAKGDCEVVVYTSAREGNLATLSQERRRLLVSVWIDRYNDLYQDGFDFVLPFETRGEEVGVTLQHPHGQIYAFPFVPNVQARMVKGFAEGYDLAGQLKHWQDYIVDEAGPLVAFVPPFARFPYEVWIASRKPLCGPWAFDAEAHDAYAALLGRITARYDAWFERSTPTMMSLQAVAAQRQ